MVAVRHKFEDRRLHPHTETLIIGTFNPATEKNAANFFYSRGRNYFWHLLPIAFGEADLRAAPSMQKEEFARAHKIDFLDLISEVIVDSGREANFSDRYIDSRVSGWINFSEFADSLLFLKRACFTRKTFSDVPNIRNRVSLLAAYFEKREIPLRA